MRRMLAALLITVLSFVAVSAQTSDAKTSDPDSLKETSATETTSDETAKTETASNESTDETGGPLSAPASFVAPAPPKAWKRQTPDDLEHRWGLSLHAGMTVPHGDFNSFFEPAPTLGVDLEYRVNNNFSVEAIFGYHRFKIDSIFDDHATLYSLSGNGKYYGGSGSVRPFVNGGAGVYVTDSGTARPGLNLGAGLQFNVSPKFAVEGAYNFHNVFFSGDSFQFSTVQGGVRFRF
jgi:opacity protein-like surface antigen